MSSEAHTPGMSSEAHTFGTFSEAHTPGMFSEARTGRFRSELRRTACMPGKFSGVADSSASVRAECSVAAVPSSAAGVARGPSPCPSASPFPGGLLPRRHGRFLLTPPSPPLHLLPSGASSTSPAISPPAIIPRDSPHKQSPGITPRKQSPATVEWRSTLATREALHGGGGNKRRL